MEAKPSSTSCRAPRLPLHLRREGSAICQPQFPVAFNKVSASHPLYSCCSSKCVLAAKCKWKLIPQPSNAGPTMAALCPSAKPIYKISRFPEEAEVLFSSNSTFRVTSVLCGASQIGEFYGQVDNAHGSPPIVMRMQRLPPPPIW